MDKHSSINIQKRVICLVLNLFILTLLVDNVFNEHMSNKEIFDQDSKQTILSALEGYNVTIFAYGQTCSGKTFTMRGYDENSGIIPQTLAEIFQSIDEIKDKSQNATQPQTQFSVKVSYLEIYNEVVNDLLDPQKKNLDIRECRSRGIYIDQLSQFEVNSFEDCINYLHKGDELKFIAETKQNELSSRSHTILKIEITQNLQDEKSGKTKIKTSEINLVDLAGSEGVSKTKSQGLRQREGANINKSLLALSNVIYKLSQKSQQQSQKNVYINYRDSKLTRILQQALSGNSQTSIICTISQLFSNYSESKETLNFGAKAKNIKTSVNINEIVKETADEQAQKIKYLNQEVERLNKIVNSYEERKKEILNQDEDQEQDSISGSSSNLQNLKNHILYLNGCLSTKTNQVEEKEKLVMKLELKVGEKSDEIQALKRENDMKQVEMQNSIEILKSNYNSVMQILLKNNQIPEGVNIQEVLQIEQKSQFEVSSSSLLSRTEETQVKKFDLESFLHTLKSLPNQKQLENVDKHNFELKLQKQEQFIEKLKSQIQMLELNLKEVQNTSIVNEKRIRKRNLLILNLQSKVEILEKQNTSLFKDFDQTLQNISVIHNSSNLDIIENYMNQSDSMLIERDPSLPSNINSQRPSIQILNDDNSFQLHQNPQFSNTVPRLTQQLIETQQRLQQQEIQCKLDVLTEQYKQLEVEKEELLTYLEEAERFREDLVFQIRELDYKCNEYQEEYNSMGEEFETIQYKYQDQKYQLENLQRTCNNQKRDIQSLIQKLTDYVQETDKQKNEIQNLKLHNSDLAKQLSSLRDSKKRGRELISTTNTDSINNGQQNNRFSVEYIQANESSVVNDDMNQSKRIRHNNFYQQAGNKNNLIDLDGNSTFNQDQFNNQEKNATDSIQLKFSNTTLQRNSLPNFDIINQIDRSKENRQNQLSDSQDFSQMNDSLQQQHPNNFIQSRNTISNAIQNQFSVNNSPHQNFQSSIVSQSDFINDSQRMLTPNNLTSSNGFDKENLTSQSWTGQAFHSNHYNTAQQQNKFQFVTTRRPFAIANPQPQNQQQNVANNANPTQSKQFQQLKIGLTQRQQFTNYNNPFSPQNSIVNQSASQFISSSVGHTPNKHNDIIRQHQRNLSRASQIQEELSLSQSSVKKENDMIN
eukprot:403366452